MEFLLPDCVIILLYCLSLLQDFNEFFRCFGDLFPLAVLNPFLFEETAGHTYAGTSCGNIICVILVADSACMESITRAANYCSIPSLLLNSADDSKP